MLTISKNSNSNQHASRCMCGGSMVDHIGTVVREIRGKQIRIHNAPYSKCSNCGDIEFDLSSRISSIAVDAYKRGMTDVIYSD